MGCHKEHIYDSKFSKLPIDQGGIARHRCAGCAYDLGHEDGFARKEKLHINLSKLPYSQTGTVRHKSPHAAYALGYLDGVIKSYH